MFGLGGSFVEVFKDVSFRVTPVEETEVSSMVRQIKGFPLLAGARGRNKRDVAAIEACDRGTLPAPIIYHSNGTVQSCGTSWEMLEPDGCKTNFTRAPFMSSCEAA